MSRLGLPPKGSYQVGFAHPLMALLHVLPERGSCVWGKGLVAASSTLLQVLPREVTHVQPWFHIPLPWADDTSGWVPSHFLISLLIPGPRGQRPDQRPCPAGTPSWVHFQ